ncbi:MAG TPA: hypothetical protein VMU22_14875 [Rhizomicrobium sp.]|nr:hypothetical protein [Rhizomicrobium sp.]
MLALGLVAGLLGGCASVVEGTTEPIYVATTPEPGATCEVSNALGKWSLVTPGTVVVKRSESVLAVRCSKEQWRDSKEYFASKMPTSALVGALLPYAGIVSAAVDGASGAGGEYPNTINITMRKTESRGTPSSAPPTSPTAGGDQLSAKGNS